MVRSFLITSLKYQLARIYIQIFYVLAVTKPIFGVGTSSKLVISNLFLKAIRKKHVAKVEGIKKKSSSGSIFVKES